MSLILTQNDRTESGHNYADDLGVEYEYPGTYRALMRTGEPFIYYRGRRRSDGGIQPQVYLGTGVVGEVRPSPVPGRLVCSVADARMFLEPVPFKDDQGNYLEPIGRIAPSKAGLYFRRGVRRVTQETFNRILSRASAEQPAPPGAVGRRYASPEIALLVDEVAMEVAIASTRLAHPGMVVTRMPHNNPGFDLLVGDPDAPTAFVEVKGTMRPEPGFFMSEGERRFSHLYAAQYSLAVVHGIDLTRRTGTVLTRRGAVAGADFALEPTQWRGEIVNL